MVSQSSSDAPAAGPRCPVVAVASGKGGVGKTNICVNLATLLARRRVRTTLIDADAGVANADVLCGLRPPRRLSAGRSARDVAIQTPGGFVLVPGSHAEVNAAGLVREATLDAGDAAGRLAALSVTAGDAEPDLREALVDGVTGGELILNLRAEGDPDLLRQVAWRALDAVAASRPGLSLSVEHEEFFRPAPPQPTHRDEVTA